MSEEQEAVDQELCDLRAEVERLKNQIKKEREAFSETTLKANETRIALESQIDDLVHELEGIGGSAVELNALKEKIAALEYDQKLQQAHREEQAGLIQALRRSNGDKNKTIADLVETVSKLTDIIAGGRK